MGTNFYAVRTKPTIEEPIHIGKRSCGWLFHFQSHNDTWHEPPVVWNTYNQVKDWLYQNTVEKNDYVIINEYDEIITCDDFFKMVDEWQENEDNQNNPDNFRYARNVDGYMFSDVDFS